MPIFIVMQNAGFTRVFAFNNVISNKYLLFYYFMIFFTQFNRKALYMKKFLVSDFDGTFYINDENIQINIEKVKEFRNNGNIFAIATGRSFLDSMKDLKKFNIEYDYLIINHGATLLDKNYQLIRNYPIDNKAKNDIKNEFNIIDDENTFVCKALESRTSINQDDITKIHIRFSSKDEQFKSNNILNTKYKDYIKSYPIMNSYNSIEIISSSTDKSIAINEIAKIENIKSSNIYTVGDSFNDIEMLETFSGFCMANSEEFVKSKIDKKVSSVAEIIDIIIGENNE